MQRTLVALGCGLTLVIGSAFAQQQHPAPKAAHDSGPTLSEKAKDAAHTIGEKAKEAVDKVKDMAHEAAEKSKSDDGPSIAQSSKADRMQKQAEADFKVARAKCDAVEPRLQKTICEKQAAVMHANAELRIAKAEAAAAGKTSTMGAGKAAR